MNTIQAIAYHEENSAVPVSPGRPLPITQGVGVEDPGYTRYRNTALAATKQSVKAGPGNLFAVNLINVNTVPAYVKFYDALVGDVTVGTTVPILTLMVPAGDGTTPGVIIGDIPVTHFTTAITLATVAGLGDDSAAALPLAVYAEITFK